VVYYLCLFDSVLMLTSARGGVICGLLKELKKEYMKKQTENESIISKRNGPHVLFSSKELKRILFGLLDSFSPSDYQQNGIYLFHFIEFFSFCFCFVYYIILFLYFSCLEIEMNEVEEIYCGLMRGTKVLCGNSYYKHLISRGLLSNSTNSTNSTNSIHSKYLLSLPLLSTSANPQHFSLFQPFVEKVNNSKQQNKQIEYYATKIMKSNKKQEQHEYIFHYQLSLKFSFNTLVN
jgi:hypothetical protein